MTRSEPEAPVRAKDVHIVKSFQAICYRPGCNWTSSLSSTYRAANEYRLRHLAGHVDNHSAGGAS